MDLLSEIRPADAARVEGSEHARLVSVDAIRIMAGVINRDAEGLPLADQRARLALNLAIDRDAVVREAMFGRASPLAGLIPPSAVTFLHRLSPYRHDPDRAAKLWHEAGGTTGRSLRVAALGQCEQVSRQVVADVERSLGIRAELIAVYDGEGELRVRRVLAEKKAQDWDVLILEHGAQAADGPPLELHRAFVGASGEFRAGPVLVEFEGLYEQLAREVSKIASANLSFRIDRFVHEEALALFLCAPQALYAVNQFLDFRPYRTTFELAGSRVSEQHWSRRS